MYLQLYTSLTQYAYTCIIICRAETHYSKHCKLSVIIENRYSFH